MLVCREGSSGQGCSSWWPPTARTLWRNAPERRLASCLTWRRPLWSSAPWKGSARPQRQVRAALMCSWTDQSFILAERGCSSHKSFPFTSRLRLSPAWGWPSILVPAVLAAGAPDEAAFMSDEAMESVPGLKPIQYTAKHYALYLDKMVEKAKELNGGNTGRTDGSVCSCCSTQSFMNAHKHIGTLFFSPTPSKGWALQNKLPFFFSGPTAGLDTPQAGAVSVGHGCGRAAAAAPSKGRQGRRHDGEALRGWHGPDASKKDQNEINNFL